MTLTKEQRSVDKYTVYDVRFGGPPRYYNQVASGRPYGVGKAEALLSEGVLLSVHIASIVIIPLSSFY
jgi:hypothetical protein